MKKLIVIAGGRVAMWCIASFSSFSLLAQDVALEPAEVQNDVRHRFGVYVYSGYFPYVIFGIVIAMMLWVGYRYWRDNADDDYGQEPHHQ